MRALRLVWLLVPLSALAAGFAIFTLVQTEPPQRDGPGGDLLSAAVYASLPLQAAVAALVVTRRPRNPIGWLLAAASVLFVLTIVGDAWAAWAQEGDVGGYTWAAALDQYAIAIGFPLVPLTVPLLFPNGHLWSRRWRWVLVASCVVLAEILVGTILSPGPFDSYPDVENPLGVAAFDGVLVDVLDAAALLGVLVLASLMVGGLVMRFRHSRGEERQQLKWLVYAVAVLAFAVAVGLAGDAAGLPTPLGNVLWATITFTCIVGLPAAIAVAVLRHGLYEVDLVINRTAVWAVLSGLVVAAFAGVVTLLGAVVADASSTSVSLVATVVVALLTLPLRDRVQAAVNRLMYGAPQDPYSVLAGLAQRLAATPEPDGVLPAAVDEVAAALQRPYAGIELTGEDGPVLAAEHGTRPTRVEAYELTHQGEEVGRLLLAPRRDESRSDARLVADVARHLAAAALAVRRTADLRHSRERIVAAREEERRRLRRDLHDGLGPALAGIDMQLAGARALLATRPDAARAALADVARDASATVADVRRLVNGLRPPALDDLGLAFAIREQAERLSRPTDGPPLDVEVTVEGDLRGLPAAVEVAAFRIAQEALVNVARHADATRCSVRLSRNGALELVVEDDGGGLATAARAGVGLVSMRERAAELGGTLQVAPRPARGTVVRALLPVNDRPEES